MDKECKYVYVNNSFNQFRSRFLKYWNDCVTTLNQLQKVGERKKIIFVDSVRYILDDHWELRTGPPCCIDGNSLIVNASRIPSYLRQSTSCRKETIPRDFLPVPRVVYKLYREFTKFAKIFELEDFSALSDTKRKIIPRYTYGI